MFVRKKPNRSGSISVVVIEKCKGKVCYLKTIGVSSDEKEINEFYAQGKKCIEQQIGLRDMFLEHAHQQEEKTIVEGLLSKVEHILLNGTQLILNPVYRSIGFDKITDDLRVSIDYFKIQEDAGWGGYKFSYTTFDDKQDSKFSIYPMIDIS